MRDKKQPISTGGSPFDLSDANRVLAELNGILQNKCPSFELQIGMLSDLPGTLDVFSPKVKGSALICLYYKGNCIASIQLVINDGYLELRSYTNKTYSGKKYNSLLRYVLVIVGPSIKLRGNPVARVHSSATNPISAHLLMKHFDSFPIMEDTNEDFLYFIEHEYKKEREPGDIPVLVDAFYKKYAGSNLSIEFEIPFTEELKEKSLRDFTVLANKLECASIPTTSYPRSGISQKKTKSQSKSNSKSKSKSRKNN